MRARFPEVSLSLDETTIKEQEKEEVEIIFTLGETLFPDFN